MASKMTSPPPYEYNNLKSTDGDDVAAPSFPPQSFPPQCFPPQSFPPQHQHPQQQMIIVQPQMAPTFVYQPHPVSMTGAIVLSCFVFWCFGWLFGAIAFILAVIGSDSSHSGDISGALRLRNASYGVSVAGIMIGVIVIIVVIVYVTSQKACVYRTNIDGMQYCE